jgi:hypothetical protein
VQTWRRTAKWNTGGPRRAIKRPERRPKLPERFLGSRKVFWLWVRILSALGIKDFRSVLLGMLRGVTAPPIDHAEAV